jgi:hypothetical protein
MKKEPNQCQSHRLAAWLIAAVSPLIIITGSNEFPDIPYS